MLFEQLKDNPSTRVQMDPKTYDILTTVFILKYTNTIFKKADP